MKLFVQFMKENIGHEIICLVAFGIIALVLWMYGVHIEIIGYAIGLAFLFVCVYGIVCFVRYQKNVKMLQSIHDPQFAEDFRYPDFANAIEKEEYRIISTLRNALSLEKQKHDKALNEMLDYYTVWVHQIKTPISAMQLRLQNEDTVLSRKLQQDLLHIEQYVEMVLAYLRLSSNQTDYLFQRYAIDEIVKRVLRKYADEFIERKITLEYQPPAICAITDEKWLCFVFEQILSNALKYTMQGKITIFASDEDTICIQDTGIGIRKEDIPRIFENGFTGYNGRLSPQASGLGLYLCQKVCHNLHHEISVSSSIGKGTKMYIHLLQKQNLSQS